MKKNKEEKIDFKHFSEDEKLWMSAVKNCKLQVQDFKEGLIFQTKVLEMAELELEKAKKKNESFK
jgi:hypothetical protein